MDASLIPAFHDALVVAQTGSVGEAARRLHKTASAVSQQIRRIEARFGVALFEKVGRGIRPSAAGEALLGSLTRLFDEAASLETLLGEMTAARVTTLRVAASDYLGEALLLPVLRRLFAEGAPLRFEITTTNSIEAGRLAAAGQVDVAMVSTDRALTADETPALHAAFLLGRAQDRPRSARRRAAARPASAASRCCAWAPGARDDACSTSPGPPPPATAVDDRSPQRLAVALLRSPGIGDGSGPRARAPPRRSPPPGGRARRRAAHRRPPRLPPDAQAHQAGGAFPRRPRRGDAADGRAESAQPICRSAPRRYPLNVSYSSARGAIRSSSSRRSGSGIGTKPRATPRFSRTSAIVEQPTMTVSAIDAA